MGYRYEEERNRETDDLLALPKLEAKGYAFAWTEYGYAVRFRGETIANVRTEVPFGTATAKRVGMRQANLGAARAAAERHAKENRRS